MKSVLWALSVAAFAVVAGCGGREPAPAGGKGGQEMGQIEMTSPAFTQGQAIPKRYSRYGDDVSPPLAWSGIPDGTREIVLICDDPDAPVGTWVHWVVYGIPATSAGMKEGVPKDATLADGAKQGKNSWGEIGYGGPQPPSGTHRYVFKVYAVDSPTGLTPGATKQQVIAAIDGHVLARGELMGTYAR